MPVTHPRRKKYIDPHLQGRHWVLLIALELLIISCALLYTYMGMQQTLEDSLYAIHNSYRQTVVNGFFMVIAKVASLTVLVNILLLALGHQLWVLRIRRLQRQFRQQLDSLAQLNFCSSENLPANADDQHELISLLSCWSQRERSRFSNLTAVINSIPDQPQLSQQQGLALQNRVEQAMRDFLQFDQDLSPSKQG